VQETVLYTYFLFWQKTLRQLLYYYTTKDCILPRQARDRRHQKGCTQKTLHAFFFCRPCCGLVPPASTPATQVKKRLFLRHLYIKCIVLPRRLGTNIGKSLKIPFFAGYKAALAEQWRLNATLRAELAVVGGYALRERSAGRLDLQLPWEAPWYDGTLVLKHKRHASLAPVSLTSFECVSFS
jgi:hypothetical protein